MSIFRRADQERSPGRLSIGACPYLLMLFILALSFHDPDSALGQWLFAQNSTVDTRVSAQSPRTDLVAGQTFRDCPSCPEMVVVPAGSFMMGSRLPPWRDNLDEVPRHLVTMSSPFALGKYPVTREEYSQFVSECECSEVDAWRDPGFAQTDKDPVVNVSWEDAEEYVNWLSQKTGKQYRLPSEAEYEYAERAATVTAYWWGDEPGDICSYAVAKSYGTHCHHFGTLPIGIPPTLNAFGLSGMAGNVWEWTEDCYHPNYKGAPSDGSAWTSVDEDQDLPPWISATCGMRIVRGGAWDDDSGYLRSASRDRRGIGDLIGDDVGFRVARTL